MSYAEQVERAVSVALANGESWDDAAFAGMQEAKSADAEITALCAEVKRLRATIDHALGLALAGQKGLRYASSADEIWALSGFGRLVDALRASELGGEGDG
jgi:hypothetical protein